MSKKASKIPQNSPQIHVKILKTKRNCPKKGKKLKLHKNPPNHGKNIKIHLKMGKNHGENTKNSIKKP